MPFNIDQIRPFLPDAKLETTSYGEQLFVCANSDQLDHTVSKHYCLLASKGILKVTGEQRLKFLQGQTTCNIEKLSTDKATFGAFCNLKGRVIANFLAYDDGSNSYLIMATNIIDDLIDHLTKFAMFFRVTLTNDQEQLILGSLDSNNIDQSLQLTVEHNEDHTLVQITEHRSFIIGSAPKLFQHLPSKHFTNETQWNLADTREGIIWISKISSEVFLPQLIGLERTEGLSFTKGCYTGQEIIARMKYRGQLKREMQLCELKTDSQETYEALQPGAKIDEAEKKNVGQLISFVETPTGHIALITLENDYINKNSFIINNNPLKIQLLSIDKE